MEKRPLEYVLSVCANSENAMEHAWEAKVHIALQKNATPFSRCVRRSRSESRGKAASGAWPSGKQRPSKAGSNVFGKQERRGLAEGPEAREPAAGIG